MSEPLERIRTAGDAEFRKHWRAKIWYPILATCLFMLASISWFFASDDVWYPLAYVLVAIYAMMLMWGSRFLYASLKAEEAKLNLVLLLLVDADPEDAEDDEPEY